MKLNTHQIVYNIPAETSFSERKLVTSKIPPHCNTHCYLGSSGDQTHNLKLWHAF